MPKRLHPAASLVNAIAAIHQGTQACWSSSRTTLQLPELSDKEGTIQRCSLSKQGRRARCDRGCVPIRSSRPFAAERKPTGLPWGKSLRGPHNRRRMPGTPQGRGRTLRLEGAQAAARDRLTPTPNAKPAAEREEQDTGVYSRHTPRDSAPPPLPSRATPPPCTASTC